jgi:CO/xanthine dehydrogenase FAD-binding subunit
MRTPVSSLSLLRPRTLAEALVMLRDEGPLMALAGCTDVYVGLQFGSLTDRRFLDLWPLRELRGIHAAPSSLRIGALTTFSELVASPIVRRRLPMLVAASREVGGRQIQNRGTLGGNIANASPAGDSLPVLAAANASIVLRSASAERRVPFTAFYTGYRASVRRPDELIAAIEIPRIEGRQYWRKVGTRRAQAISKVMCAAVRGPAVTVALGSVAPTVIRLPRTEEILSAGGSLEAAQEALDAEIAPIDDIRSTAPYRRAVSANLLRDFWRSTS